jgi:ADP-ribosylglycohydrolase
MFPIGEREEKNRKERVMKQSAETMVFASFTGDALALGAHWIYDTEAIARDFGMVENFLTPLPGSYHSGKVKGDLTHYGDQELVLLRSIADAGTFDIHHFHKTWREFFESYDGYVDSATRQSLRMYSSGRNPTEGGSNSNDLAGAVRIAPLVYLYRDNPDLLDSAAGAQTAMTHNDPPTVSCARFFASVAARILRGSPPLDAITAEAKDRFNDTVVAKWVESGIESRSSDTVEAISRFGQTCHTPEAFPGVMHLIARYENNLEKALIQSVMAGGDSAARNMAVGMILGAWLGEKSIPALWMENLRAKEEIASLLAKLPVKGTNE